MYDHEEDFGQKVYDKYYLWQRIGATVTNAAVIGVSSYFLGFNTSLTLAAMTSLAGIAPALVACAIIIGALRYFSAPDKNSVSERFNTFVLEDQADAEQKTTRMPLDEALNYVVRAGFCGGVATATLSPYYIVSNILFIPGWSKYPVLPRPYL